MAEELAFARKASGLVRGLSMWDAFGVGFMRLIPIPDFVIAKQSGRLASWAGADAFGNGVAGVSNNLSLYRGYTPGAVENPFFGNFQFSDAQGNVGKTYVSYVTNYSGPLPSAYTGLFTVNAPVHDTTGWADGR